MEAAAIFGDTRRDRGDSRGVDRAHDALTPPVNCRRRCRPPRGCTGPAAYAIPVLAGRWGVIGAGASSGFMNAIAGVGGPPIAIYAATTNWSIASFIPTSQVTYLSVNLMSLLVKGWPSTGWTELSAAVVGVVIGAVLGAVVADRIPERHCFLVALLVAALGGTAGIVRGVVSL